MLRKSFWKELLYFASLLFFECCFVIGLMLLYAILSMINYGENTNRFLGRTTSSYILFILIVGLPFGFNVMKGLRFYKEHNAKKTVGYAIVSVVLLLIILFEIAA